MSTLPYIGSKISLISNADIRYEGILYTINTEESTIALQNVKSFGTEGRKKPEIAPSNETYHFIIFRGKDIKDLTVLSGQKGSPSTADPAIVSYNQAPRKGKGQSTSVQQWWSSKGWGESTSKGGKGKSSPPSKGASKGKSMPAPAKGKGKSKPAPVQTEPRGTGRSGRRGRGAATSSQPVGELIPDENATPDVGTDFDLAAAGNKMESKDMPTYDVGYDKSKGFFDTISSDAHRKKDQKDQEQFRMDREKQREVDKDTFGATALKRPFGRRAGRGRGRRF